MSEGRRLHLNGKMIFIFLTVLLLVISICLYMNGRQEKGASGTLTVVKGGTILKTYAVSDLKAMDAVEVGKTIRSGSQEPESGIFSGVPLETLLADADENILAASESFILRAADGYESAIAKNDVETKNNVLIIYAKDGQDLIPSTEGGAGPIRAIIVADPFGNRSAKDLVEIEVK